MAAKGVLFGGLAGGAIPYLLGMAHEAVSGRAGGDIFLYQNPGYWLGTLLFGLIGAVVVYFFGESDRRKAFVMGAAAPGLVLGLAQGGSQEATALGPARAETLAAASWLISDAMAQPAPAQDTSSRRRDTLWVRVIGLDSVLRARTSLVTVGTHLATGSPRSQDLHALPLPDQPAAYLPVPRTARGVFLTVGDARTDTVTVSGILGDTLTLRLDVKDQRFLSGFARVFGVRSVAPLEPRVTVVVPTPGPQPAIRP